MATTEIEKLERRYAENPQGLTFAPLAEVHRKNGDIPRALELLKSGLELHPNYIPASIVLGRCYWDQGDLPAAEAAFAHVLRLDDENVIALKSLADISERLGRAPEAQRWLKRLISIDRSNEDARQHLIRLEAAKAEPAPVSPEVAEIPPAAKEARAVPETTTPVPEEPAAVDLTAAIADPSPGPNSEARDEAAPALPALEFLDTSEPPRHSGPVSPAAEPSLVKDEVSPTEQPAQVDGLISQEFVPPKEGGYHLHPELSQEFGATADALDQLEVETAAEVELESSGASEFRVPNAAEDFMEAASHPPPAPPQRAAAPPAPAPFEPTPPPPTPARASYSAHETRGQSVAAFFQAMLSARPPRADVSGGMQQDGRAPSAPAQETPQPGGKSASQPTPMSPAVPAGVPPQDATVSFDDFFGAPAGGSGGSKGSSDGGEDDLDQFQSWLQNLKP
jgi:tetratricopeptide (TPR) repeat protein